MKANCIFLLGLVLPNFVLAQGSLTPPGAPGPTMKTLNQVEARTVINSTNTPGDASSIFVISAPGSYYLTGNITGVAGKNGILVIADNVSIDLNGFAVIGVASSLEGIVSGTLTNLSITNGTVRSWVGDGIHALNAGNGQYQNLRLSANGLRGLNAGRSSAVLNCTSFNNGSSGISVGLGSTVTGCTAEANLHGFSTDSGVTVTACSAYANIQRGISVGDSCTVSGSTVRSNGTDGITTGNDCNINRCIVRRNDGNGIVTTTGNTVTDCTVSFNGVDGILVDAACLITRNNCRQNGRLGSGNGIHVTGAGQNRIEDNNATSNTDNGFYLQTDGNILIRNTAGQNLDLNFVTVAGNSVGPIVGGSNPITSTNPWANFSY